MSTPKIYSMSFAKIYPLYIAKAERKGRSKSEVDQIIQWLTGYDQAGIEANVADQTDLETFFSKCPEPNPNGLDSRGGMRRSSRGYRRGDHARDSHPRQADR